MGYRIEYGSSSVQRKPLKRKPHYAAIATAVGVLSLVFLAIAIKHAGLTWVRDVLLPGDPAITAAALENMVDSMRSGSSIAEAVTAFCQEILANAQ